MLEEIRVLFFKYMIWVLFLPLALAVKKQKSYTPELKFIFYYLIVASITQVMSFIFWKLNKNNLPILHVYTLLEYLVLLRFYSILLKGFIPGFVFSVLAFLFSLFAIIDSLVLENIFTYNTYSRSLEALILIFLSLSWFVKIAGEDESSRLDHAGINYINAGLLVYFSGSVVLFAYSSYVAKFTSSFQRNIWTLHTLLAVQLYLLITIGLWKTKAR